MASATHTNPPHPFPSHLHIGFNYSCHHHCIFSTDSIHAIRAHTLEHHSHSPPVPCPLASCPLLIGPSSDDFLYHMTVSPHNYRKWRESLQYITIAHERELTWEDVKNLDFFVGGEVESESWQRKMAWAAASYERARQGDNGEGWRGGGLFTFRHGESKVDAHRRLWEAVRARDAVGGEARGPPYSYLDANRLPRQDWTSSHTTVPPNNSSSMAARVEAAVPPYYYVGANGLLREYSSGSTVPILPQYSSSMATEQHSSTAIPDTSPYLTYEQILLMIASMAHQRREQHSFLESPTQRCYNSHTFPLPRALPQGNRAQPPSARANSLRPPYLTPVSHGLPHVPPVVNRPYILSPHTPYRSPYDPLLVSRTNTENAASHIPSRGPWMGDNSMTSDPHLPQQRSTPTNYPKIDDESDLTISDLSEDIPDAYGPVGVRPSHKIKDERPWSPSEQSGYDSLEEQGRQKAHRMRMLVEKRFTKLGLKKRLPKENGKKRKQSAIETLLAKRRKIDADREAGLISKRESTRRLGMLLYRCLEEAGQLHKWRALQERYHERVRNARRSASPDGGFL